MSRFSSRWLAAAALCLAQGAALAAADELWLSGAEGTSGGAYAYLGRIAPLPGNKLGQGWYSRLWVDWTRYEYEKNGVTHRASAPGAEAALGYSQSGGRYWWSVSSGLVYRDTRLSPDDPDSEVRGGKVGLKMQAEAETALGPAWRLGGNLSYVIGPQAYWARGRLLRELSAKQQVGVEVIAQGDPDYRARQLGLVLNLKTSAQTDLGIKLGVRKTEGLKAAGYFGIEFGRRY